MSDTPIFTVIVSTFNRGPHIVPTINSALEQTLSDFELVVIGDGATDNVLAHVPRGDGRVTVIALPRNSGSQSTPNNVGIAVARGRYIAYLGHDDVWMPDHLEALALILEESSCDVAVSGCAFHGPPGTDLVQVTGIFEDTQDASQHFFPPTSLAHRASLAAAIGGWRAADTISAPADADFLLRAVEAAARFGSTGHITAHKFAAGHRYLSYLEPSSKEQNDMLAAIRSGAMNPQTCTELMTRAKTGNTFMVVRYPDFSGVAPGDLYRQNRANKGIDRAAVVTLTEEVYVPQSMEPRALDWYPPEQSGADSTTFRWSGPSLRPKLLIPFCGSGNARITLHLKDYDPAGIIDGIRVTFNAAPIRHQLRRDHPGRIDIELIGRLYLEKPSVVELLLPRAFCPAELNISPDIRRLGVILNGFTIAPRTASPKAFDDWLKRGLLSFRRPRQRLHAPE